MLPFPLKSSWESTSKFHMLPGIIEVSHKHSGSLNDAESRAHVNPHSSASSLMPQSNPLVTRVHEGWENFTFSFGNSNVFFLERERSRQAGEGECARKTYTDKFQYAYKSQPSDEVSISCSSGSNLLGMAGEKAPFYQGCGCGIVIDTSINCCLLKCHGIGFLPHFQLQGTADGRSGNNEDPFLRLRLKNLLLFTAKKCFSRLL